MRRPTWLDQIVYGFQHRWETAPQFRAVASGLVGLVVILIMCSCVGVLNTTANSALAAIGLGGSGNAAAQGTPNTGTNQVNGYQPIPTPSVIYPTGVTNPVATVPQSQTPPPGPTATSTPTATDTPTPGSGGGGAICNGSQAGTQWWYSPCPISPGQTVTLNVKAPGFGGGTIVVEVGFGTCSDGCQMVYSSPVPIPAGGVWSASTTLGTDASGPIMGYYAITGGPKVFINGGYVQ